MWNLSQLKTYLICNVLTEGILTIKRHLQAGSYSKDYNKTIKGNNGEMSYHWPTFYLMPFNVTLGFENINSTENECELLHLPWWLVNII